MLQVFGQEIKNFWLFLLLLITERLQVLLHRSSTMCCTALPHWNTGNQTYIRIDSFRFSRFRTLSFILWCSLSRSPTGQVVHHCQPRLHLQWTQSSSLWYTFLCSFSTWVPPFLSKFAQYSFMPAIIFPWDYVLEAFRTDY